MNYKPKTERREDLLRALLLFSAKMDFYVNGGSVSHLGGIS